MASCVAPPPDAVAVRGTAPRGPRRSASRRTPATCAGRRAGRRATARTERRSSGDGSAHGFDRPVVPPFPKVRRRPPRRVPVGLPIPDELVRARGRAHRLRGRRRPSLRREPNQLRQCERIVEQLERRVTLSTGMRALEPTDHAGAGEDVPKMVRDQRTARTRASSSPSGAVWSAGASHRCSVRCDTPSSAASRACGMESVSPSQRTTSSEVLASEVGAASRMSRNAWRIRSNRGGHAAASTRRRRRGAPSDKLRPLPEGPRQGRGRPRPGRSGDGRLTAGHRTGRRAVRPPLGRRRRQTP